MNKYNPKPNYFKLLLNIPLIFWAIFRLINFHIGEYISGQFKLLFGKDSRLEVNPAENDSRLRGMLDEGVSKEALEWLSESNGNTLYGYSNTKSKKIVDKLYSLGSTKIWAIGVEEISPNSTYSRTLILELPKEELLRKRLFNWEYSHARAMAFDGTADCGQSLMLAYWT